MDRVRLQRPESILDGISSGVVLHDLDGQVQHANPAACRLFGRSLPELRSWGAEQPDWGWLDSSGQPLPEHLYPAALALRGIPVESTAMRLLLPEGGIGELRVAARIWRDEEGGDAGVVVTLEPLGGPGETHEALAGSEEASPVAICVTDDQGRFEYANPAYCRLCGYALAELLGRHFTTVIPEARRDALAALHEELIAAGTNIRGEHELLHRSGEVRTVLAEAVRTEGTDGSRRALTYLMDITSLKERQERLSKDSATDGLTGLYNRRYADEALEREVQRARRYGIRLAVALLDIDHFKSVNDRFGHPCGDRVLATLADMLARAVRRADIVARYGGEEFMIVFPQTSLDSATWTCERIRVNFAGMLVSCAGGPITLSIGVSAFQPDDSTEDLVARVDRLLYEAKESGRNRTVYE